MSRSIFVILSCLYFIQCENVIHYDTFTGRIISDEEYEQHVKENTTFWCTGKFKDCDPEEGRRLDQTCSNLEFPTRGTSHSPFLRELPPLFGIDFEPVKKKNGQEMVPARKVRLESLAEADIPDQNFTILFPHFFLFTVATQTSFHDSINYVLWKPNCCKPEGKEDPMCYPHKILPDDTVHRFTGLKCMNQTRPITFQSLGCLKDSNAPPERMNSAAHFFGLNVVYTYDNQFRSFKDGKLIVDEENGRIWPVGSPPGQGVCVQNAPGETRCHKAEALNAPIGVNLFGVLFWREHNVIAEKLKHLNPHWSDDKLFFTARNINSAYFTQIFYYEMLASFMGKENLIKDGILSKDGGFRKTFKKGLMPQIALEYVYVLRWGHTIMPGLIKMYNNKGVYMGEIPSTNLTSRTGYLAIGDHYENMLHGGYIQPAAKIDQTVDPFIAETGMGNLQYALDITMADLAKGGLQGIANYVSFRKLCTGKEYKTYEDLSEDFEPEYIEIMKKSHEDVSDIPLLLGVWLERAMPGGFAPRTLYCIASRQYKRFMQYDRHWYEDPDRPDAFTAGQLAEVRKITVARILCDSGHTVERITSHAFLREGPGNRIVECKDIPQTDYTV